MSSAKSSPGSLPRHIAALACTILAIGIVLRFGALGFQLWLDEIWAWQVSRNITSPADLFAAGVLDGHFSLYTLWLSLFESPDALVMIRLPSFILGTLQVILVFVLARRWAGNPAAIIALILNSVSFFFVLYATEARAYAPIGAAALAAIFIIEDLFSKERLSIARVLAFWFVVCGAILVHLSFVPFYVMLLLWSVLTIRGPSTLVRIAITHAVPLIFLAVLAYAIGTDLPQGSGPLMSRLDVSVDTLSYIIGGPPVSPSDPRHSIVALLAAIFAAAIIFRCLVSDLCSRSPRATLYLLSVIVLPLVLFALNPKILLPRYFYIPALMASLLLAEHLGRGWEKRGLSRLVACIFLALLTVANSLHLYDFYRLQRGNLKGALQKICAENDGTTVIAGDHEFRNSTIIDFYAPMVCKEKDLKYRSLSAPDSAGADFIIHHSQDIAFVPLQAISHSGSAYSLYGTYPYAGLSGWSWYVYKRK